MLKKKLSYKQVMHQISIPLYLHLFQLKCFLKRSQVDRCIFLFPLKEKKYVSLIFKVPNH